MTARKHQRPSSTKTILSCSRSSLNHFQKVNEGNEDTIGGAVRRAAKPYHEVSTEGVTNGFKPALGL